jgi:hypothetical protein
MDYDRAENTSRDIAEAHFKCLAQVLEDAHLMGKPQNVWNADETSLQLGEPGGVRVLAARGAKRVARLSSKDRRHVTVMFAFNAAGVHTPPVLLLPTEQRMPQGFLQALCDEKLLSWGVECTGSGWMKEQFFRKWLQSFVAYVDSNVRTHDKSEKHLLLLDQHSAHMSFRILSYAEDNNILLYYLPPHTTHFLQPADVGLFKPIKTSYHRAELAMCADRMCTIKDIPPLFAAAMRQSCTVENMRSAFMATGVYPFDPRRVVERMFGQEDDAHPAEECTVEEEDGAEDSATPTMQMPRFGIRTAEQWLKEEEFRMEKKMALEERRTEKRRMQAEKNARREAERKRKVRVREAKRAFREGNMVIRLHLTHHNEDSALQCT